MQGMYSTMFSTKMVFSECFNSTMPETIFLITTYNIMIKVSEQNYEFSQSTDQQGIVQYCFGL